MKRSEFFLRPVAAAVAIAMTVGCASVKQNDEKITRTETTAIALRDAAVNNTASGSVVRTDRPRLAGEEVVLVDPTALPPVFAKKVTYSTQGAQALSDVLETVSGLVGIRILNQETTSGDAAAGMVPPQLGQVPGAQITGRVQIEFNGTLRGLLDDLSARENASWRYSAKTNTVDFFRYETRTLSLYLPPGAKTIAATISLAGVTGGGSGGGGGGAASGGGNVSVDSSLTVDPWKSIMGGIQSILSEGSSPASSAGGAGPGGGGASAGTPGSVMSASGSAGRAAANPELGLITITARPRAVHRVAAYVESINQRFAQNVMVDIKIYSLSLDNQASLGFSLDALYQRLNSTGVSIVGASPLRAGNGNPGQLTISASPASRVSGSQLVVQALQQFGRVALQTQGQVIAVNGQPAPIQVANEVNYLASSATTQTANVGSTSTLTPGTRVVGFTANFLPLILDGNRILLQYQMQISSLTALTQVNSGTSSIQTPQISSQSLQQQAFVRDGQSIVLFGFDQDRTTLDNAINTGGASAATASARQMVVIVMQVSGGQKNV